jgi:hypothetical protein
MEPLPLPSHVHYELLLQLLERRTLLAADRNPIVREQVQQLIVSLRRAYAQQKQLEAICQQTYLPIEHRWSLNSVSRYPEEPADLFSAQTRPVPES